MGETEKEMDRERERERERERGGEIERERENKVGHTKWLGINQTNKDRKVNKNPCQRDWERPKKRY